MKLDTKHVRYLTSEDWRVLTAVEMGSKNHEIVPTSLIVRLSNLRAGSAIHKSISTLAKADLIARMKNAKYDGYRLTYGGLDYLSLHTHVKRDALYSVGNCIGVGKESDIYVCAASTGAQQVLKIHRLGRISFRSVKNNRDYLRHRSSASWMHMSRLAALKEWSFMKALKDAGFNVPQAVAWSRHTVVMELVEGLPLRAVPEVSNPAALYNELIEIILRLASFGLIHGDFNEFNIMIKENALTSGEGEHGRRVDAPGYLPENTGITPVIIDFPQMVSIDHVNAEMYFDRDVNCIKTFFKRKFSFSSNESGPFFADAKKLAGVNKGRRLDVEVEASGFSKKMAKELETYTHEFDDAKDGTYVDDVGYDSSTSNDDFQHASDPTGSEAANSQTGELPSTLTREQSCFAGLSLNRTS